MRPFTWLIVAHILLIAAHNAAENDSPAQVVSLDEGHSGEAQLPFNLALPWAAAKKPAPPVRPALAQLKVAANEQMATGQKRAEKAGRMDGFQCRLCVFPTNCDPLGFAHPVGEACSREKCQQQK